MIYAIIPAAGRSQRMGKPKLTMPIHGQPALARLLCALREGGIERILVIVEAGAPELPDIARSAGAVVHVLDQPTAGMRETVLSGLARAEECWRPDALDAWLLAPGDYPAIALLTVRLLCGAQVAEQSKSIFVPVYQGRRGHPVLMKWQHVAGIRTQTAGEGIDRYLRDRPGETLEIAVNDAGILRDMDVPQDYEELQRNCGESDAGAESGKLGAETGTGVVK